MKSVFVFSICVVAAAASYGYAPSAYGGSGSAQGMGHVQPALSSGSGSASSSSPHQIIRLHHEIRQDVANNVQYETTNGIRVADNTQILPGTPNPENPSERWNRIAKSGFYAYTAPEGRPIEIHWTADGVNGFRATGNAIPTPPAPMK